MNEGRAQKRQKRLKERREKRHAEKSAKPVVRRVHGVDGNMNQTIADPKHKALSHGLAMVASAMAVWKKRGNPKDWVVLSEHFMINDGERAFKVQAKLPEKLDPGQPVYVVDASIPEQPMRLVDVLEDQGEQLLLRDEKSEWVAARSEVFPTPIPGRATPVHKRFLFQYVGHAIARNWWANGRRVNPSVAKASDFEEPPGEPSQSEQAIAEKLAAPGSALSTVIQGESERQQELTRSKDVQRAAEMIHDLENQP